MRKILQSGYFRIFAYVLLMVGLVIGGLTLDGEYGYNYPINSSENGIWHVYSDYMALMVNTSSMQSWGNVADYDVQVQYQYSYSSSDHLFNLYATAVGNSSFISITNISVLMVEWGPSSNNIIAFPLQQVSYHIDSDYPWNSFSDYSGTLDLSPYWDTGYICFVLIADSPLFHESNYTLTHITSADNNITITPFGNWHTPYEFSVILSSLSGGSILVIELSWSKWQFRKKFALLQVLRQQNLQLMQTLQEQDKAASELALMQLQEDHEKMLKALHSKHEP